MTDHLIKIAHITSPSGIKGFVRVHSLSADPQSIFKYQLFIDNKPVTLTKMNSLKNGLFVCKLDISSSIDDAEALRGKTIYTARNSLPDLEFGEHYAIDLLGFDVISKAGEKIGKVLNIINYGASDILEYETLSGYIVLIPLDAQFINEIKAKDKTLVLEHYEVV